MKNTHITWCTLEVLKHKQFQISLYKDCIHVGKINFKIAEVCISEKDGAMIFFGGHNNLIMVCEPLLPFRVKSYVSD